MKDGTLSGNILETITYLFQPFISYYIDDQLSKLIYQHHESDTKKIKQLSPKN